MKIVFVTSHLTVFVGGGNFLMNYANKLSEKGNEITIVVQKVDNKNYQFNHKINLIEIGGPIQSSPFFWLSFMLIKRRYEKVLNKLESDLFISLNFPSNYYCVKLKNFKKITHIYYCLEPFRFFHDKKFYKNAPFLMRIGTTLLRFIFKKYDIEGTVNADKIICISKFTANRVKKYYHKKSDYLHYIGVDFKEENDNYKINKLKQNIIFDENIPVTFTSGLTHHLKGVYELMYIFSKILDEMSNVKLLIGGWISKENNKKILKLIKKFHIPLKSIHFCGFIEKHLLNYIYKNASVTFYTAIDEAYGLIPLESMKNGTPVIAFEGGPSETIIDGETGYIIKDHNLDDFASKAINLIQNKSLHEEMSYKAKNYVRAKFNFEDSVLNLEKIFKKIISKK